MQWLSPGLPDWVGSIARISNQQKKHIQFVGNGVFFQKYILGEIMFDSNHCATEIRSAKRKSDGCEVVVKRRFKPECFSGRAEEREWRSAMELMMNLPSSSGVAQILEVLEDKKALYIVIEKASGVDLRELLNEMQCQFSVHSACEILAQLLEAVAHLHENGAIHRDLKLENIVVNMSGPSSPTESSTPPISPKALKVVDFDTVQSWSSDLQKPEETNQHVSQEAHGGANSPLPDGVLGFKLFNGCSPGLQSLHRPTRSSSIQGTNQYIPQEAYAGAYSPLSDIFSLGVLAYRLVVGKFPFREDLFDDADGDNDVDSPKMKQMQYRLKVTKVDWTAPVLQKNPSVCDLIQKMMASKQALRPTAKEALQHEVFASRVGSQAFQEKPLPCLRSSNIGLLNHHGRDIAAH